MIHLLTADNKYMGGWKYPHGYIAPDPEPQFEMRTVTETQTFIESEIVIETDDDGKDIQVLKETEVEKEIQVRRKVEIDVDPIVIDPADIAPADGVELVYDGTQHFYDDDDDYIGGFGDGAAPPIGSTRKDSAPVYVPSAEQVRIEAIDAQLDGNDFKVLMIAWAKANPDDVPDELKSKVQAAIDA